MEPTTRDHLITAAENREFACRIHVDASAQAVDYRWAAVAAFYSAVHYFNGFLWEKLRIEPGSHSERSMLAATVSELRVANASYLRLRSVGYNARYVPLSRHSRAEVGELVENLEAIRVAVLNALQPTDADP